MKKFGILFALLFAGNLSAQFNCQDTKAASGQASMQSTAPINYNSRSDTIDLVHLKLNIDATSVDSEQLSAVAEYSIGIKINCNTLRFDLLGFTVDSVSEGGTPLNFYQSGEHLIIGRNSTAGQIATLKIYYHGATTKDASGWGGMHHDAGYHYNLGVGFAANPHVYGRSLFPCFDNFVEKFILKEMNIITGPGRVGVSNGTLLSVDTLASGNLRWNWRGLAALPSYLISFAVTNYSKISWTHDNKPFEIYGRPQDTANIAAGFIHLNDIYDAFTTAWGPYKFEKVGYALTITGAMEHAGMIHLPRTLANAALQGEDIIAHELAHMWFGNAITTETAEDMWINEGFAEFGSHYYEEYVYGRNKYIKTVQNNQALVLKQAASSDGGHLALSGVNQEQTYGTHTYQKGAMVAHNLRMYLGDSLFNHAVQYTIASNTFGNYNAQSLKSAFEQATGKDLTHFWQEWILNPGYHGIVAHLSGSSSPTFVDSLEIIFRHLASNTPSTANLNGKSVPVHLYLHSFNYGFKGKVDLGSWDDLKGNTPGQQFTTALPIGAIMSDGWVSINDSAESLGTSVYDTFTYSELNGTKTLPRTGVKITPLPNMHNLNGTFYVWHHYTEGAVHDHNDVSAHHYYTIGYEGNHDPIIPRETPLPFECTIPYNTLSTGLDRNLNYVSTDSLTLYVGRTHAVDQLLPASFIVQNTPIGNTGRGMLKFQPQELFSVFAPGRTYGLSSIEKNLTAWNLYPNPTKDSVILHGPFDPIHKIRVKDGKGKTVFKVKVENTDTLQIDTSQWAPGLYLIELDESNVLKFEIIP